jgi:two-component system response regulator YesN
MSFNEDTVITTVEKIINGTPTEKINVLSVKMMSEQVGMKENTLSKQFKRKRGYAISKLLTSKKPEKAVKIIKTMPCKKISEISKMSGYENAEYFCRIIKKSFGKTPTEIRKEDKI